MKQYSLNKTVNGSAEYVRAEYRLLDTAVRGDPTSTPWTITQCTRDTRDKVWPSFVMSGSCVHNKTKNVKFVVVLQNSIFTASIHSKVFNYIYCVGYIRVLYQGKS